MIAHVLYEDTIPGVGNVVKVETFKIEEDWKPTSEIFTYLTDRMIDKGIVIFSVKSITFE